MSGQVDVAVVGGGAIGLCCAYALRRRGANVVLLERDLCGEGASFGNAGWITPALATPVPAPAVWRELAKWMFVRERPLRIKARLDPSFFWWLAEFSRKTGRTSFEAGARAMLGLGQRALASFDALAAAGIEFETHTNGLTFVALSDHELAKYQAAFRDVGRLGYRGGVEPLTATELRALEPALTAAVAGGLRAVDERHVRPDSFTRAMRAACEQAGVSVLERTPVLGLEQDRGRVAIRTADRVHAPEAVVVAAGAWTRPLLATIGIRLPIESAKGYSITIPGKPPIASALYLAEARLGVSPFDHSTRVAGMLELTGIDRSLSERRLRALVVSTRRYLPGWSGLRVAAGWSGLRPLAPDGLPVIGRCSALENLYVASGHGMLGITLAPTTGEALAPVVLEGLTREDLAPFTPDRYIHAKGRRVDFGPRRSVARPAERSVR